AVHAYAMPSEEQRLELGASLRARRTALRPEDVGPPQGVNRRRTLGLRREELAQLAGISVSWYTRLEQGKDVQFSAKAVARALGGHSTNVLPTAGIPPLVVLA